MIRNVIFDMGNVLVKWDPQHIAAQFTDSPEGQAALLSAIFRHPEWAMQDEGLISEADMRAHVLERVPEQWREAAGNCMDAYEQHVQHIHAVLQLAEECQQNGRHIFILSNAAERFWHYLHSKRDFDKFEGIVISAMEKMVKPDARIYRLTAERFGLNIEECVFIDDVQANVDGARAVGMEGIRFDGDAEKLREALHALEVL